MKRVMQIKKSDIIKMMELTCRKGCNEPALQPGHSANRDPRINAIATKVYETYIGKYCKSLRDVVLTEIATMIASKKKLAAVKLFKEEIRDFEGNKVGLKEAKDACDEFTYQRERTGKSVNDSWVHVRKSKRFTADSTQGIQYNK